MKELWGRKDLHLVGVLALREISLAMERGKREGGDGVPIVEDLTAGGICRKDFFAVKVRFGAVIINQFQGWMNRLVDNTVIAQ